MNQTTDTSTKHGSQEFSREYLLSLAGVAAAVLLLVFGLSNNLIPFRLIQSGLDIPRPFGFPWIIAAGLTIAGGLDAFSGMSPALVSFSGQLSVLIMLLVVGVIGPTLFLLTMQQETMQARQMGRRAAYLIGVVISASFFFLLIPTTLIAYQVRIAIREAQAVQRNKDMIIDDLNEIAWRVREYAILPVSEGGGGGSLERYEIPAEWKQTEHATYDVTGEGDMLLFTARSAKYDDAGVSVKIGKDGAFWDWDYYGLFE